MFPYTQPEQPRVEFCLIVLRIEENIMPIDIQFDVNTNRYPTLCHLSFKFISIVIKCTRNRVPIDKQLRWTNPVSFEGKNDQLADVQDFKDIK